MAAQKLFEAKNEVHITEVPGKAGDKAKGIAPTAPKVAVIPAKGKFMIDPDSDTCKELLARGVISPAKEEKPGEVQKVGTKKAAAKKPAAKKPAAKPAAKATAKDGEGDGDGDGGDGTDMV